MKLVKKVSEKDFKINDLGVYSIAYHDRYEKEIVIAIFPLNFLLRVIRRIELHKREPYTLYDVGYAKGYRDGYREAFAAIEPNSYDKGFKEGRVVGRKDNEGTFSFNAETLKFIDKEKLLDHIRNMVVNHDTLNK